MLCNESPNIPFTVFRMCFSQGKLNLEEEVVVTIAWRTQLQTSAQRGVLDTHPYFLEFS